MELLSNFVDNRRDSGYQLEPPYGNSPSVIIFGEKHGDTTEIEDIKDLIKELGLAKYVLLAENKDWFEENWKGKYGCEEVVLCDLEQGDQDKKRIELLRGHLPTQELERSESCLACGVDSQFENCVKSFPYLMQLFYDAKEKEMGEIIRRNSKEPSKPVVVIIGHYHARKDSEVHKILEKNEIDHICIWNEKEVQRVKKKYQFFRRNSAQDSDIYIRL